VAATGSIVKIDSISWLDRGEKHPVRSVQRTNAAVGMVSPTCRARLRTTRWIPLVRDTLAVSETSIARPGASSVMSGAVACGDF